MADPKKLEQHIAVFGESGSGKTVLLSSFYGAAQENKNIQRAGFHVFSENQSEGTRLHKNYLGMRDSGKVPPPTTFVSTSYTFQITLAGKQPAGGGQLFTALRVVWHDYPGEWFEQGVSGPEEAARRVGTFRDLLQSDVAILMVDGQRLLDYAGEEERYLKSLFAGYCNTLLSISHELLIGGKPLVVAPRIWMIALSKADLLPEMGVEKFRDLMIEKGSDEIEKFRGVLEGLLDSKKALSVGEDFVRFSSARFEVNKIAVEDRIGLNLILPIASALAFERHLKWAQAGHIGHDVLLQLVQDSQAVAAALGIAGTWILKVAGSGNKLIAGIGAAVVLLTPKLKDIAKGIEEAIAKSDAKQVAKVDGIAGVLSQFRKDLDEGEKKDVLLRSIR